MRRRTDFLTLEASFVIRRHAFYIFRRFEAIKCASKTNCFVCTSFMWIHRKSFVSAETNATATRGIIDANAKIVAPNVARHLLMQNEQFCAIDSLTAELVESLLDCTIDGRCHREIHTYKLYRVKSSSSTLSLSRRRHTTLPNGNVERNSVVYVISSSASRRCCRDAKWWTNINL